MSAPLLTDEQKESIREKFISWTGDFFRCESPELAAYTEAIESAVRAPLLAEIKRLTAERDAAVKSMKWFENEWKMTRAAYESASKDLRDHKQRIAEASARKWWATTPSPPVSR